jgi:hypothetical protein
MKIICKSTSDITIENGSSRIKVLPVTIMADPYNKGRVAKIYVVKRVERDNAVNSIIPGQQIALSFPPERLNAKSYQWHREQGEPCQIDMKLMTRTMRARV